METKRGSPSCVGSAQAIDGWKADLLVAAGFLALCLPTLVDLARIVWPTDEQGHGPVILGVSLYLAWQRRNALAALPDAPSWSIGSALLIIGLLSYVLGRSQKISTLEVSALLLVGGSLLLLYKGWPGMRVMLFPLFFLLFMIPLPGVLVQSVTTPLKAAVSHVAEQVLYASGYPVARSGVVLQVGQYQLLVADACAGMNTMFTLEALSLLYLNLMQYTSTVRRLFLALMAIPIAFCANVVRVVVLVLVTYYFGDEAGQGFVHGFAGMVLFLAALLLLLGGDAVYGILTRSLVRMPAQGSHL